MDNILDYIKWRGDLSFSAVPFNDADAAIFAEFSYLPLEGVVPEDFRHDILLGSACRKCDGKKMMMAHEQDAELAEALAKAPRFSELSVCGFRKEVDEERQFCVMTVKLGHFRHLVIFQGTDESLIGWKEDLQLSYMKEIPAQKCAVEYLNEAGKAFRGEILTCGHSKGGNLAIYAPAFCNERISKRVSHIVSFDGPGFNEDVIKDKKLDLIKGRVTAYAPAGSFIGMLLEHNTEIIPVNCRGISGMIQHNLFNWEINTVGPSAVPEFSNLGEMNRDTLKQWVGGLTYAEREEFTEALFSIFSDQKNVDDLLSGKSLVSVAMSFVKLDKEKKQALNHVMNNLGTSFRGQVLSEIREWAESRRDGGSEQKSGKTAEPDKKQA